MPYERITNKSITVEQVLTLLAKCASLSMEDIDVVLKLTRNTLSPDGWVLGKDVHHPFDKLLSNTTHLPEADREVLYFLVEEMYTTATEMFLDYYRAEARGKNEQQSKEVRP